MRSTTHRRLIRLTVGLPAVLTSWALLVGLPLAPAAPGPGHLITATIALTGPHAASQASRSRTAAAGWTATVAVPSSTQSMSLSWVGTPTGSVRVRSRSAGHWSAWTSDAAELDEGPDRGGNGRTGIGPIWLGHDGADQVQVRIDQGALTDLSLDAMRWQPPTGGGIATAGAEPSHPAIHSPSEWGSGGWRSDHSGCAGGPVVMKSLRFAVIHHTVNANNYSPADVPGLMAAVYRYHTASLGWCDTAYNFIIDRFGGIWQGRSGDMTKPILGGHAKGFNTSSIGVAFLGQYEPTAAPAAARPSQAALDAARNLIAWKFGLHGIDPTASIKVTSEGSTRYRAGVIVTIPTIIGHRDVGLTACPGGYLYSQLPAMRLRVAALLAASKGPWSPFSSASALVAQQFRDVLRRDPDAADIGPWVARLENKTWSVGQFVATLLDSAEAARRVASVVRLYFAFFLRTPDHNGITYWLAQRGRGRSLASVADSFAASAEFGHRYGHLSDAGYIERVYTNVLARSPDRSGLDYWLGRLAAGVPRGQLMANFSESAEYQHKSLDQVLLVTSFEALLHRAIDSSAFSYYRSRLTNGTPLSSVVATLFASSEYQRRF